MEYTQEQKDIIALALPPNSKSEKIIRVTAAAGTGKTTTLEAFANRLCTELNHGTNVIYITFSNSAVNDAESRLNKLVQCKTIHAAALQVLGLKDLGIKLVDDNKYDEYIGACYENEIERFLDSVEKKKYKSIRKQVITYIRKTLTGFLQSSHPFPSGIRRHYPAFKYHLNGKIPGLPDRFEASTFYERMARRLYEEFRVLDEEGQLRLRNGSVPNFISYDMLIKEVQLHNIKIQNGCTALLVDEAQDCSMCQIDWLSRQRDHGTQVVFVGDAAQTIYSFRGAKSKYLMEVNNCIDQKLVSSFRFGKEIAAVANTILFSKEHSPQTKKFSQLWLPYRVSGIGKNKGLIEAESFPLNVKHTVIAKGNITLFNHCLEKLFEKSDLKVCINGKGESSGAKKFAKTFKEIDDLLSLYEGNGKALKQWYQFRDEDELTWDSFKSLVADQEKSQYGLHITLIDKYGSGTKKLVAKFQQMVLDKSYSPSEADIIVTTVHSAKGMEWDNVQVLDDLCDLSMKVERIAPNVKYEFAFLDWGDDVNLWYVAVTRARRALRLPPKFVSVLTAFSVVLTYADQPCPEKELEKICLKGDRHPNSEDLCHIYKSLVKPWMDEMNTQLNEDPYYLLHLVDAEEDDHDDDQEVDLVESSNVKRRKVIKEEGLSEISVIDLT